METKKFIKSSMFSIEGFGGDLSRVFIIAADYKKQGNKMKQPNYLEDLSSKLQNFKKSCELDS